MATVIAPMLTGAREGQTPQPAQRYACTHIVNTAYVVDAMQQSYVRQYGILGALPFIARIEVLRGNTAPAGETFHHVSRGYGG